MNNECNFVEIVVNIIQNDTKMSSLSQERQDDIARIKYVPHLHIVLEDAITVFGLDHAGSLPHVLAKRKQYNTAS